MPDTPTSRHHDAEGKLAYREFVSAALYMTLVLMAVLVALPHDRVPESWGVLTLLLGTAAGLMLAHWIAFRWAAHLAEETGTSPASAAREAGAQVGGGVAAAVVAGVPLLLLDGRAAVITSLVLLSAVLALTGLRIGRLRGLSWPKSVVVAVLVLAVALAVVGVKAALGGH